MTDSLAVKVSYTLQPNPQVFYARIRQPIQVIPCPGAGSSNQDPSIASFAQVSLKACLSAICKSRPDLLLDLNNLDYAIASLDFQETQYVRDNKLADQAKGLFVSPIKSNGNDKVWEGKGLLSWALQASAGEPSEQEELIVGKVDSRSASLEVCLQLTERKAVSKPSFLDSLYSSTASPAFPAATASPVSASGLSPSCFDDSLATSGTSPTWPEQPQQQADVMINVIQPTPVRPDLTTARTIASTSSSPAAVAANHPKRALSAPLNSPLLSVSEEVDSNASNGSNAQQQQILGLIQQLLPQFQANPQESATVMPLIQTLVQYLASPPPPPSPSTATTNSPNETPVNSFLTMESLVSLLTSVRQQQPSAEVPVASTSRPSHPLKSSTATKRKRDTSAPPAVPSSSTLVDSELQPAKSKKKSKGDEETEAPKLKYDAIGCSNCGTHYATLWRKSKKEPRDRLCNACGVYFNRQGKHRPPEWESDTKLKGKKSAVTPTLPTVDAFPVSAAMKPSMTSPPRNLEKSPRRHSIAASSPARSFIPNFVTTESPGTALNRIMSDAMEPEQPATKKKRIKAKPTSRKSEPTSDLPFGDNDFFTYKPFPPNNNNVGPPVTSASVASSMFSETWQPQTDVFSALTSEMDQPRKRTSTSSGVTNLDAPFDFNALFSDHDWTTENLDVDMNSLFSDQGQVKGIGKEIFADIPPSSPPFKHLLPGVASASESGESPSNQTDDSLPAINPTTSTAPPESSSVIWSSEAVNFLQHALTQDPNMVNLDLSSVDLGDQATLQDLFTSLTNGLSPGSAGVGTPAEAGQGLDVGLVAQVDAETAMEIWEKEVQTRFQSVPTK